MSDVMHVACSCKGDGAYAAHSATMLDSVLARRGSRDVHVHYLHGRGFPSSTVRALRRMVESAGAVIDFLEVDPTVIGASVIEPVLWYRALVADLVPEVDRVLYLDVDVIALDELEELWATPLTGYPVAAVTNVLMREHIDYVVGLGLDPERYFNTGVLLMNLALWRAEGLGGALLDYAQERGSELEWADQDAMNLLIGDRRRELHPRWNAMTSLWLLPDADDAYARGTAEEARRSPSIRHFEGPGMNKPWHYMCDRPLADRYFAHRARTPWPRCDLEARTLRNRLRRRSRAARARLA